MIRYIALLASLLLSFSSCQKVIDVNLNNAKPRYVIEAPLYEGTNDFVLRITKTTSYFTTDLPPGIETAVVKLIDNNNTSYQVNSIGNGNYQLANFTANPGASYTLQVNVDGQEFKAVSALPIHTSIDSLSFIESSGPFGGGEKGYLAFCHFQDSVGIKNYYRVKATINGEPQDKPFDYYLFDDMVRDGQYIDAPLFTFRTELGDTLDIELLGMDANVFDYFNFYNLRLRLFIFEL